MARVYGIKKRLEQSNVDANTVKAIIGNGDLTGIISRMERLLAPAMMQQILDTCACGGGKAYLERCEKIGKEIAGRTMREKVDHINSISPGSEKIVLHDDNTLTVTWSFEANGQYACICSAAARKGVQVSALALADNGIGDCIMPLSYCYCCAGSGRRHLQLQLGVELKTMEIISSPINSRGEKPCQFTLCYAE